MTHSFHIPVMGIGFTIDTPLKVSQYGIDSVIAIGNDNLLEKLRKFYCTKYAIPYEEITEKAEDFAAKRITAYLNLINELANRKFDQLRCATQDSTAEIKKYFNLLPDNSTLKQQFKQLTGESFDLSKAKSWLRNNLSMGSIDVNILTKADKENYDGGEKLPIEYNGAHTMLRGYADSNLSSSLVLSAGMNPRLYGYMAQFEDFFPDESGKIKKKIVLKVSDFRSAFIQGKFLAKKGLWVSEYRIESGLNCGGHAFATDGHLLGPIMAEFRDKRNELIQSTHELLSSSLATKGGFIPETPFPLKVTVQGGVGTAEEHQFLIDHYQVDSVGWGSPFLLVPEATNVDELTLNKLIKAKEDDLYLSSISPLGIPFNSLKNNTKEIEKKSGIQKGSPGSPCPLKYLTFNTEFTPKAICTASRQYQNLKIKELNKGTLTPKEYENEFEQIVDRTCICTGLSLSVLQIHGIETKVDGNGVSICPGPNIAYFSSIMSLKEITDHIYGKTKNLTTPDRPNMFVKELNLYIDFLRSKFEDKSVSVTEKRKKYLMEFAANLKEGVDYYRSLFEDFKDAFKETESGLILDLKLSSEVLGILHSEIQTRFMESCAEQFAPPLNLPDK